MNLRGNRRKCLALNWLSPSQYPHCQSSQVRAIPWLGMRVIVDPYANIHVILPFLPVFGRHLFHLYHHLTDASEYQDTEKSQNLWMLYHPMLEAIHCIMNVQQGTLNADGPLALTGPKLCIDCFVKIMVIWAISWPNTLKVNLYSYLLTFKIVSLLPDFLPNWGQDVYSKM